MTIRSRFDWDAGNLAKCQKHGVTTVEIEHVLDGEPFLVPDHKHSEGEDRNIAVTEPKRSTTLHRIHAANAGRRGVGAPAQRSIHAP